MSTATSIIPTAVDAPSPARRGQSYSGPSRTQSSRTRTSATTSSPARTSSQYNRPPSSSRAIEDVLPQRDYGTSNLNRSTSRRSRDRPPVVRAESSRTSHHRTSSRSAHQHQHQPSDMSEVSAGVNGGGPAPVVTPIESRHSGRTGKPRTTIPAQSGNWILGKTIGAGSMGKVKLARRAEGGEQVAVKIVPRGASNEDGHNQSRADRERAEQSKEIRTAREAAIVTLLDHPYICGMRDVVRTNNHWYMLFEYVNGGQMLDYIISHGKLKEKQARKFSRQIASALDYCHRNSIVHRDLKIENILISKTGDIKIIDFGLSNLFSPKSHLKTFCGSLYFAAPELLQAKQYLGPEVDVWSFGIVLYVLVCGKVPFDDQSMPALHAKIKKGVVDYPSWLSTDCKSLISRMLVTDPKQRASLQEIMNHPWMTKGFGAPPENYLPPREPLQLPLDPAVIHAMTGFDFGSSDVIYAQLTKVIESDEYQRAARLMMRERELHAPKDIEKKRGFGFDFYKRRSSAASRDTLTIPSSEGLQLGTDPINAFNPLISVYYLVREKQERDRLAPNPGATSMPRAPKEAPLQLPDIAPPQAAHTNSAKYEMPGETATGGRSRPRARTHGEDEVTEAMGRMNVGGSNGVTSPMIVEPPAEVPVKRESTAANILRRLSTRKRKEPLERERPDKYYPPIVTVQSPSTGPASTLRNSLSISRTRTRSRDQRPASMIRSGSSQPQYGELLTPPQSAGDSRKGLGRSASVNSAEIRRRHDDRGPSEGSSRVQKDPPQTSGSEHSNTSGQAIDSAGDTEQKTNLSPRANTRAKSLGHARRESIQARRAKRDEAREANVPEETEQDLGEQSGIFTDRLDGAENVKPVFLKGLFSVSTTSTKPVSVIRSDIIRVLRQLGVEYTEVRGGFSCRHAPSIDLKKVVDAAPMNPAPQTPAHRRRISFGGFNIGMGGPKEDKDDFRDMEKSLTPRTPRRPNGDTSYTNSDASVESVGRDHPGGSSGRAMGETSTHVQSELGGSMILEFEIFIVKVPLLSLHGIQFKRLAGGTWQYKNMADQILKELRL